MEAEAMQRFLQCFLQHSPAAGRYLFSCPQHGFHEKVFVTSQVAVKAGLCLKLSNMSPVRLQD